MKPLLITAALASVLFLSAHFTGDAASLAQCESQYAVECELRAVPVQMRIEEVRR